MKAELKRLHSPDVGELRTVTFGTDQPFGLLVQAMVGPAGQDDAESFDFVVCNPAWLREKVERERALVARHHLVVAAFDYVELERFIRAFCDRCEGTTWQELATQVGRLGHWEFEDYRP